MVRIIRGHLVENRIVVWDMDQSRQLFKDGFYGKPLGIAKPKDSAFDAPLILDLIEGYYLARMRVLEITKGRPPRRMGLSVIERICEKVYVDFKSKYLVYRNLRESGFVVTPGIKFGCDFAVYEHGPGIDHAPYLVQVIKPGMTVTATGIVLSGRLATTVKKQFIVALADVNIAKVEFISFDWWRA